MTIKVVYGSDLHFEFGGSRSSYNGLEDVDMLVLAGDVVTVIRCSSTMQVPMPKISGFLSSRLPAIMSYIVRDVIVPWSIVAASLPRMGLCRSWRIMLSRIDNVSFLSCLL